MGVQGTELKLATGFAQRRSSSLWLKCTSSPLIQDKGRRSDDFIILPIDLVMSKDPSSGGEVIDLFISRSPPTKNGNTRPYRSLAGRQERFMRAGWLTEGATS
jgi:hypothetical protein